MIWLFALASASFLLWLLAALAPDRAHLYAEAFVETSDPGGALARPSVTALVPARNEEGVLPTTLPSLLGQEYPMEAILIDDQSSDRTAEIAREIGARFEGRLRVLAGEPLPDGWAGKMWALSQGAAQARGEWLLLTDADIRYPAGLLDALMAAALREKLAMVSLMARLSVENFWEKLLTPAFLYFFKMLYPFRAVRDPKRRTAAAAGGCILIRRAVLEEIGGFAAIRNALIDDIALARAVKGRGHSISLMVAPRLLSERVYQNLGEIRRMVTRSAFTELKYSYLRLAGCAVAMTLAFLVPAAGILAPALCGLSVASCAACAAGLAAWALMAATYFPTIAYFALPPWMCLTLPAAGALYLAMTLESAARYTFGTRSSWKGRTYAKSSKTGG